jgi:hypothetical protein
MVSTIALGDVHDVFGGRIVAVVPPIHMETRRVQVGIGGSQPQTFSSACRQERVEFGNAIGIEGIQGAPQGIIIELVRCNTGREECPCSSYC